MALKNVALVWGVILGSALLGCDGESDLGWAPEFDRRFLGNGIEVIIAPMPQTRSTSVQAWVRSGTASEPFGQLGMTSVIQFLGARVAGAEFGAFDTSLSRDYLKYSLTVPADGFDEALARLAAIFTSSSKVDQETLNGVLAAVVGNRELKLADNLDLGMGEMLWSMTFPPSHGYSRPTLGLSEDVRALSLTQVQAALEQVYHPLNLTFVVAGPVDADSVMARMRVALGGLTGAKNFKERLEPSIPAPTAEKRFKLKLPEFSEPRFVQGYLITASTDKDTYALDLLSNILFRGSEARITKRLVLELGLATQVSGLAFTPRDKGLFLLTVKARNAKDLERCEAAVDSVIHELIRTGVTPEEVRRALLGLVQEQFDAVASPEGLADWLGTVRTIAGDPKKFLNQSKEYARVTPAQIRAAAERYLDPNRRTTIWSGL